MKETLIKTEYSRGMCSYLVEKEIDEGKVSIVVYSTRKGSRNEVRRIKYIDLNIDFSSPFLSWYNLLFCSNNYGPPPDYDYMHTAVQAGTKTAATVYLKPDSNKGRELVNNLPEDCDAVPYGDYMIFVFHKGCLADYFNYDKIRAIYELYGVRMIDWAKIKDYFQKPMYFFANESQCGFSLQSGGSKEQTIITGLLLGYPIESTISILMRSSI